MPAGLAAIWTTLLAMLKAGDHLLVCDNVYRPSRNFCDGVLSRYGVETIYFDPTMGGGIEKLFKPNSRAVLLERARNPSRCLISPPSSLLRMGMARSSSTTTPEPPCSIIVRWNSASISVCRPPPIYCRTFGHHVSASVIRRIGKPSLNKKGLIRGRLAIA